MFVKICITAILPTIVTTIIAWLHKKYTLMQIFLGALSLEYITLLVFIFYMRG